MTVVDRNCFWNLRLKEEMPLWKRLIWRTFGEKLVGESDGYTVTAYRLRNVTLVHSIIHEDGTLGVE